MQLSISGDTVARNTCLCIPKGNVTRNAGHMAISLRILCLYIFLKAISLYKCGAHVFLTTISLQMLCLCTSHDNLTRSTGLCISQWFSGGTNVNIE
jgi:hypothetical protein